MVVIKATRNKPSNSGFVCLSLPIVDADGVYLRDSASFWGVLMRVPVLDGRSLDCLPLQRVHVEPFCIEAGVSSLSNVRGFLGLDMRRNRVPPIRACNVAPCLVQGGPLPPKQMGGALSRFSRYI